VLFVRARSRGDTKEKDDLQLVAAIPIHEGLVAMLHQLLRIKVNK
jgi:hypothetical protein